MGGGEVSLPDQLTQALREDITTGRVASHLEPVAFASGDVLIRQRDAAYFPLFIEDGTVTVQLERPSIPPLRLRSSTAGTIVGEMGLYSGGRRTAAVAADSAGHAVRLTRENLARMQRDDPVAAALMHCYVTVTLAAKTRRYRAHAGPRDGLIAPARTGCMPPVRPACSRCFLCDLRQTSFLSGSPQGCEQDYRMFRNRLCKIFYRLRRDLH